MTDGRNRFIGIREMAHHLQHARVEPKVLRRPASRNYERVVIFGPHIVEGRVESEVVAALLAVGLIALEIVDGGTNGIAGPLIGATAWTTCPTMSSAWNGTITS